MKYYEQNLRAQFPIDGTSASVLQCLEGRVSDRLISDMREYLLGYSDDMQLEIADNLLDCATGQSIHYTGLKYIDRMLKAFYLLIFEEQGKDIGELIQVHKDGGHYKPSVTITQTKTISFE